MRLFQYWDTGDPPPEVAAWVDGFRSMNPEMSHTLYDRDQASWFIGKRIGLRERRTFDTLLIPAMQADYFRLCAICSRGGVWVDADYQAAAPLREVLDDVPEALFLSWFGHVDNSFMMCRSPAKAFLSAALRLATLNIETRMNGRAYMVSGPGALSAIRVLVDPESTEQVEAQFHRLRGAVGDCATTMERARTAIPVTPELKQAFQAARLIEVAAMKPWLSRRKKPAYKQTSVHWQNWVGSIYAEPAG